MKLPMWAFPRNRVIERLGAYWKLTKSLQTGLLLTTGLAGYASARCPTHSLEALLSVAGSLFLAIAGSTVLNMVWDRDIDAKMLRACLRPLPAGRISRSEGLALGLGLSAVGLGWSASLSSLYGAIVLAGWFFDVVVYTMWLKRRTAWSIIWGGIAGAMPVLAGRALGTGQVDLIGILLALSILLWIPTHMLTFGIKYADQYRAAGVPIFPNLYGESTARTSMALSTGAATVAMLLATWNIGLPWRYFHLGAGFSALLLVITLNNLFRSGKSDFALYKFASLYMLGSMVLIMLGTSAS